MTADIDAMNLALLRLGQEPVSDLTAPTQAENVSMAKLLRAMNNARDVVLARHGWLCALQYVTLSPAPLAGFYATYANWRYDTVYEQPADSLRLWEIEGALQNDWAQRWEAATWLPAAQPPGTAARRIIRASGGGDLEIAYVARIDWSALDTHLVKAIALRMAADGCYSVTGDIKAAAGLEAAYEGEVQTAISIDATQQGGQEPWADSIPARIRNFSR